MDILERGGAYARSRAVPAGRVADDVPAAATSSSSATGIGGLGSRRRPVTFVRAGATSWLGAAVFVAAASFLIVAAWLAVGAYVGPTNDGDAGVGVRDAAFALSPEVVDVVPVQEIIHVASLIAADIIKLSYRFSADHGPLLSPDHGGVSASTSVGRSANTLIMPSVDGGVPLSSIPKSWAPFPTIIADDSISSLVVDAVAALRASFERYATAAAAVTKNESGMEKNRHPRRDDGVPDEQALYESIPVYCVPATHADFIYLLRHFAALDAAVGIVAVVLNGVSHRGEAILLAMRRVLPRHRFLVWLPRHNTGVAASWNAFLRFAFAKSAWPHSEHDALDDDDGHSRHHDHQDIVGWVTLATTHEATTRATTAMVKRRDAAEFCVIANADITAHRGILAQWAVSLHEQSDVIVGSRLARFALFAITRLGFQVLGEFDENFWPAYFEDTEYHVRAITMGWGKLFVTFGCGRPGDTYTHVYRANRKLATADAARRYEQQLHRSQLGEPYMRLKWGTLQPYFYERLNYYRHPFNDSRIQHSNSWVVDPAYRRCVAFGEGVRQPPSTTASMASAGQIPSATVARRVRHTTAPPPTLCPYNVSLVASLVAVSGRSGAVLDGGASPSATPSISKGLAKRPPRTRLARILASPGSWRRAASRRGENIDLSIFVASKQRYVAVRWTAESWRERVVFPRQKPTCTRHFFGGDPAHGRSKSCEFFDPTDGTWRLAAKQDGDAFSVPFNTTLLRAAEQRLRDQQRVRDSAGRRRLRSLSGLSAANGTRGDDAYGNRVTSAAAGDRSSSPPFWGRDDATAVAAANVNALDWRPPVPSNDRVDAALQSAMRRGGVRTRYLHRSRWTVLVDVAERGLILPCERSTFAGPSRQTDKSPPIRLHYCDVYEPRPAAAGHGGIDGPARLLSVESFSDDNGWVGCGAVPWSEGLYS